MKTNNYIGRHDENRGIVIFFAIFGIILVIIAGIIYATKNEENKEIDGVSSIDDIASYIEDENCSINKFELSGNKLVISGELKENITDSILSKLEAVEIVFKDKDGDKYVYGTNYYISTEGIDFSVIKEESNESEINLDEFESGEYFVFLRIKYESSKAESGYRQRYYTLKNNTDINELEYNSMDIFFSTSTKVSDYLTVVYN